MLQDLTSLLFHFTPVLWGFECFEQEEPLLRLQLWLPSEAEQAPLGTVSANSVKQVHLCLCVPQDFAQCRPGCCHGWQQGSAAALPCECGYFAVQIAPHFA